MILITGHQGFIGSHLTKALDKLGIKWIGYDLKSGQDINESLQLEALFDSYPITAVIHLAALTGARRGDLYPKQYFATNVDGTQNVAVLSEIYGVEKLIAFSSSSAISPRNIYGMSKKAMEYILGKSVVPQVSIVRPFNVYAEQGRPDNVVFKWLSRVKEGLPIEYHGNHFRNHTHVDDIIDGILILLNKDVKGKHIFDFGHADSIGLEEVLKKFKDKFTVTVDYQLQPDVPVHPNLNNNRMIGWSARRNFLATVDKIIK